MGDSPPLLRGGAIDTSGSCMCVCVCKPPAIMRYCSTCRKCESGDQEEEKRWWDWIEGFYNILHEKIAFLDYARRCGKKMK